MKSLDLKIQKAICYAIDKHHTQKRKGTKYPYSLHPVSLAMMLIEEEQSVDIIAAAILHDTIEDTDTTYEEIKSEFGQYVADLVMMCTEQNRHEKWEMRKEATLNKFSSLSDDAKWVVIADKLHNLYSMHTQYQVDGERLWTFFVRGYDKQKWYYESLLNAFKGVKCLSQSQLLLDFEYYYKQVFGKSV